MELYDMFSGIHLRDIYIASLENDIMMIPKRCVISLIFIPRDALKGHRRGKKRVAYVFIFFFLVVAKSNG